MKLKKSLLLFLAIVSFSIVYSQNSYRQFLVNRDFKGMLEKAQIAFKTNKKDSIAEFYIGFAYTNLKDHKNAIKHLLHIKRNGWNAFPVQLNLAKNYALLNQFDKAVVVLEEVAATGNANYSRLDDPQFASIQNYEAFKNVKQKMYANAFPCKAIPDYRRFDFWIGEWDIFSKGTKTGESSITNTVDTCGIIENYKPLGGSGGSSISYYDSVDKKWKQEWVSSGGVSHYVEVEDSKEGDMQILAKSKNSWLRMTWYNNSNGTVRQHQEISNDKGQTWTTGFDGIYKRKQ